MQQVKATVRERVGYWFDNLMARGTWVKVRLLLFGTLIYILAIGAIIVAVSAGSKLTPAEILWKVMMLAIGKGVLNLGEGNPAYIVFMFATILYGIFLTSTLIGIINNAIRVKVDALGHGRSRVLESGHVLILGYNEATFVLLKELIGANANQPKQQCVVVLGSTDRGHMEAEIRLRCGQRKDRPKTRIVCRTGSYYNVEDLQRCAIESARAVIVNATLDFDTVRAVMACTNALSGVPAGEGPFVVAAFRKDENLLGAETVDLGSGMASRLELMSLSETMARIMVHTSRHPGLSDVFTELFNYAGQEFYIDASEKTLRPLIGKSIAEINAYLPNACAVGVSRRDGTIEIGAPHDVILGEGDGLIVIEEDDDALKLTSEPAAPMNVQREVSVEPSAVTTLVLGSCETLNFMVTEFVHYLAEGSTICVATKDSDEKCVLEPHVASILQDKGIGLNAYDADVFSKRELWRLLEEVHPQCILVLSDHSKEGSDLEDEQAIRLLLLLREYRRSADFTFSITCEILQTANKELVASMMDADDFIVGRHLAAMLMAQISQTRAMKDLFEGLLACGGYEVYIKRAAAYVPIGQPLDLFTVYEAVANRNEVFIGLRRKQGDRYETPVVNPPKLDSSGKPIEYTFSESDYFVVLAEGIRFTDGPGSADGKTSGVE